MALGLLCSSWEGQMAFPSLGVRAHQASSLQFLSTLGTGFWGGDGAQNLPKGGIHSFNFVGVHISLFAAYLSPNFATAVRPQIKIKLCSITANVSIPLCGVSSTHTQPGLVFSNFCIRNLVLSRN